MVLTVSNLGTAAGRRHGTVEPWNLGTSCLGIRPSPRFVTILDVFADESGQALAGFREFLHAVDA